MLIAIITIIITLLSSIIMKTIRTTRLPIMTTMRMTTIRMMTIEVTNVELGDAHTKISKSKSKSQTNTNRKTAFASLSRLLFTLSTSFVNGQ